MTILAVHKQRKFINIASDSRYTVNGVHTDSGPKIFKMSAKIFGPIPYGKESSEAPVLYACPIGLAFTGNTSFFFTLKARLEWVLEYLQIAKSTQPYSEIIKDVIFTIYKNLVAETNDIYDADVILLLNDSSTGVPKAFSMCTYCVDNLSTQATVAEIEEEYSFWGSGKYTAEKIYPILLQNEKTPNIFRLTKKIISACNSASATNIADSNVGGDLQAGILDRTGFEVRGIQDFCDFPNRIEMFKYCFGGMILHSEFSLPKGINVRRSFLKIHTEDEIRQRFEEIYKSEYLK